MKLEEAFNIATGKELTEANKKLILRLRKKYIKSISLQ